MRLLAMMAGMFLRQGVMWRSGAPVLWKQKVQVSRADYLSKHRGYDVCLHVTDNLL